MRVWRRKKKKKKRKRKEKKYTSNMAVRLMAK